MDALLNCAALPLSSGSMPGLSPDVHRNTGKTVQRKTESVHKPLKVKR